MDYTVQVNEQTIKVFHEGSEVMSSKYTEKDLNTLLCVFSLNPSNTVTIEDNRTDK
jgi:hypothetical protein